MGDILNLRPGSGTKCASTKTSNNTFRTVCFLCLLFFLTCKIKVVERTLECQSKQRGFTTAAAEGVAPKRPRRGIMCRQIGANHDQESPRPAQNALAAWTIPSSTSTTTSVVVVVLLYPHPLGSGAFMVGDGRMATGGGLL